MTPRAQACIVFRGGTVRTLDPERSDATAVAVAHDRIVAVGADADMAPWIDGHTRVIELDGAVVVPGINDAHLHLALWSESRMPTRCSLVDATTLAEMQAMLRAGLSNGDSWLVASNWHDKRIAEFADGSVRPTRAELDQVSMDIPMVLHHDSLHAVLVNSAALALAGIDADTEDPSGGRIDRDEGGEPTGLLLESAGALVTRLIPEIPRAQRLEAMSDAMRVLSSMGITSITDPAVWPQLLRDYVELRGQGRATVRVNALLHWDWPSTSTSESSFATALRYAGVTTGLGDSWVRVGGVKLFADGVPGAGTACMHHPYADGTHGDLVVEGDSDAARRQELIDIVAHAHRHRLNAQIHVTGDAAADHAIDALEAARRADPWPGARHALIHGTLLSDGAPKRLHDNEIAVVTQSLFKYFSGPGMVATIGRERWDRTFPVRRLLDAGVVVADSSDAPCVQPDWRLGMVTFTGGAEQELAKLDEARRITRLQSLRSWTCAGAYLEGTEREKGTVTVGKLADLAVLDVDPLTANSDELSACAVLYTMVDGRIVYTSDPAFPLDEADAR